MAQSQNKYVLASLPMGKNGKGVTNLGVFHKSTITYPGEIAYLDTGIINHYFRLLAKEIDPAKAILVVEYPVTPYNKGIVTTDSNLSIWITPEMRKLGFKKWIAADVREQNNTSAYFSSKEYLSSVANKYFFISQPKDSLDFFKFPELSFILKDSIPANVVDSALKSILYVAPDILFELNVKKICSSLKLAGYIPVVVLGSAHVLALDEPCVIQVPNLREQAFQWIYQELNILKAHRFLIKFFLKKNNLMLVPK